MNIKNSLAEERVSRDKVLESRYKDVAAIETHISRLVENEMNVCILNK